MSIVEHNLQPGCRYWLDSTSDGGMKWIILVLEDRWCLILYASTGGPTGIVGTKHSMDWFDCRLPSQIRLISEEEVLLHVL